MTREMYELLAGALLHDIGKLDCRPGKEKAGHSQAGAELLRENGVTSQAILECVQYHHPERLETAPIAENSPAYIVHMADDFASPMDRRNTQSADVPPVLQTSLLPVFNLLNEANGNKFYTTTDLDVETQINYPTAEQGHFTQQQYASMREQVLRQFKTGEKSDDPINALNVLLETLESELSYVPSSMEDRKTQDIPLFDHLKMTAAFAQGIAAYLQEKGESNYREVLYTRGKDFHAEKAFLLASLDVSGIQKFIYTITTTNALRMLRGRSFYLEILMEHLVDTMLERMDLCRAALFYTGGGHAYLLLPNTEKVKRIFDELMLETNDWFIDHFGTALYIAGGYVPCSSNDLKNLSKQGYTALFRELGKEISEKKNHRYSAEQLIRLNHREAEDYSRECRVCHSLDRVNEDGVCPICEALTRFSSEILYAGYFTILKGEKPGMLPLPFGYSVCKDSTLKGLERKLQSGEYRDFVRAYRKNCPYSGELPIRKIWAGSYTLGQSFQEFADEAGSDGQGIGRVGILRADVDNLGHAFVSGFRSQRSKDRYVTLTRTAVLSRQLSMFFKLHLNKLLQKPEFSLRTERPGGRRATIVYSGGDDLFIVGAWDDIIELSVDIQRSFARFTDNTLTISAGIGLYTPGYPIAASALEVEEQVDRSKDLEGKNAITLLEDGRTHEEQVQEKVQVQKARKKGGKRSAGKQTKIKTRTVEISDGTYHWQEFEDRVVGEKFRAITDYFDAVTDEQTQARGNSFLYHQLSLIREQDREINFARFVYLLARMEPPAKDEELHDRYVAFADQMVKWVREGSDAEQDRRELRTAIELYVYLTRRKEQR